MIVSAEGNTYWVLIDLDATCAIGSVAGQKVTSTAYFPPEMARYKQEGATVQAPKATVQFEMFYFGLLVYQLCTRDAELVWKTNQADNMINWETDSRRLAYHFEEMKLDICNRIQWSAAADLCLWCLQPRADRRPKSMDDVLRHPFFDADPARHCTPAWQLHYPDHPRMRFISSAEENMASATMQWAVELHTTIETDDVDVGVATLQQLFHKGSVHYDLRLQGDDSTVAQRSITPLHRATRCGHLDIMKLLLDEIHPQALSSNLNMRTEFDFTVLHWACFFNHGQIVKLLLDRPKEQQCDTSITNYRGKTAWDVAEAVRAGDVLKEFEDFATLTEAHPHANPALRKEKHRRERRPAVDETFRDDIELDLIRFTLWCTTAFSTWKRLAEGAFGQVFLALFVSPAIEVRCVL